MASTESTSLNNMLKAILAQANTEQNLAYPPYIYDAQRRATTSYLISSLVEVYPDNNSVIDILRPFVKVLPTHIKNGYIELPPDYRNILGNPSINVKSDGSGECHEKVTDSQFKTGILKAGCKKRPIVIVPQSEFDYRTTSEYNYPTNWDAIGYFYGSNKIKVCPYDVGAVELMYVIKEPTEIMGYIMQPDDTYIFDEATTTETLWTSAAFKPIFKAMTSLYAAFSKDNDMRDWGMILKQVGLL